MPSSGRAWLSLVDLDFDFEKDGGDGFTRSFGQPKQIELNKRLFT